MRHGRRKLIVVAAILPLGGYLTGTALSRYAEGDAFLFYKQGTSSWLRTAPVPDPARWTASIEPTFSVAGPAPPYPAYRDDMTPWSTDDAITYPSYAEYGTDIPAAGSRQQERHIRAADGDPSGGGGLVDAR